MNLFSVLYSVLFFFFILSFLTCAIFLDICRQIYYIYWSKSCNLIFLNQIKQQNRLKLKLEKKLSLNEVWHIWLGGGRGYFRHSSKSFYIKGIAVGQPPISYHFWVCWWTSFFEKLRPLRLEVAEICWGCRKQPQAHKKCFHNKNLVF